MLEAALARAERGEGSAVLVSGESGIGKSRLLSEFAARARATGATVLWGECLELAEGELPYAPIVGALRSLLRERGDEALVPPARRELTQLLSELAQGSRPPADAAPLPGAQARLFEQLLAALSSLGREAPAVLVVEDLQWADRSTRDFLSFLVRNARRERLVLVASYRTEELGRRHPLRPFVVELERSGGATRLSIEPFSRQELVEQVTSILDAPPEPALVERLADRSDGNPFFAEELLAACDFQAAPLPESLRDALLLRVERLSAAAQSVVQIAAVAGRRVEHELLASVAELAEAELIEALREAVSRYVLVHDQNSSSYSFRHALLREAVYADLLPGQRRSLHVRLARALAAHPELTEATAGVAAEVAYHWHSAQELGRALPASVRAGMEAEAVHALSEARLHFERALAIWDRAPSAEPPLGRLEVTRRAADAANLSGDPERAIALARTALDLIDEDSDRVGAALGTERLARYVWSAGREEDALPLYRRAVELMPADPPSAERALVLAAEGQVLMLSGRAAESSARCEEAIEIARRVGARAVEAHALNTIGPNCTGIGEYARAVEATSRARRIARQLGQVEDVARSYINESDALDQAGRVEESIALALEGIGAAGQLGLDQALGDFLRAEVAGRLLTIGRWAEGEALMEELSQRTPTGLAAALLHQRRGALRVDRGEFEAGARDIERAGELLLGMRGPMWLAPPKAVQATMQLWLRRPEAAAATVEEALEKAESRAQVFFTARLYELGARAAADTAAQAPGDRELRARSEAGARTLLERLDALLADFPHGGPPRALAARGACAAELSRIGDAGDPRLWAEAEHLWEEISDRYQAAYGRFRRAEALIASRADRREAQALCREARAVAVELAARPLENELEALARRARLDLKDGQETPAARAPSLDRFELTPRELDVLPLLADGRTNREIAEELFISDKTASVHVSRILAKLGVRNRAEAAAVAHRLGAVTPVDPDGARADGT